MTTGNIVNVLNTSTRVFVYRKLESCSVYGTMYGVRYNIVQSLKILSCRYTRLYGYKQYDYAGTIYTGAGTANEIIVYTSTVQVHKNSIILLYIQYYGIRILYILYIIHSFIPVWYHIIIIFVFYIILYILGYGIYVY